MLQALDFLAANNIVHRDVKPENILYSTPLSESDYEFQLGDFGLCNPYGNAKSQVSTPLYMAPELYHDPKQQATKVDIWSLLVTLLWTRDHHGFREISKHLNFKQVQSTVLSISSGVSGLEEMARIEPVKRASAAQLLVKYFEGAGLTTPKHFIPAIFYPAPTPAPQETRDEQGSPIKLGPARPQVDHLAGPQKKQATNHKRQSPYGNTRSGPSKQTR
ncbi:MAG: hypothetical protein Q9200_003398 [Gallowayella weberi]